MNYNRERGPAAIKPPVNPKFIDQDESCPSFGGQERGGRELGAEKQSFSRRILPQKNCLETSLY